MTDYHFVTNWLVEAPIEQVWEAIVHSEHWPTWWKAVESVVEIEPGDTNGIGKIRRYTWKTPLSYKLTFDIRLIRTEAPTLLEGVASGDVDGIGLWQLEPVATGTLVRYTWNVKTTKLWMNLLALLIQPLMEWNHNAVMRQGGKGLAQLLGTRLISSDIEENIAKLL